MKFIVSLSELQAKLQKVLPAVAPKSTLPILEHLNFKLEHNKLQIIATNQDITIMTSIEVQSEDEGSVLVPARKLDAFVKTLGNTGDLEISVNEDNYELSLITPKGSFKLKGLNPEEFLDIPELFESHRPDDYESEDGTIDTSNPGIKIKKEDIVRLSSKTIIAVSNDEFRPAMTGVLFQFKENKLNAVATDGYRLVKADTEIENNPYSDGLDIIIPSKTVELLKKIDEDVIMSVIQGSSKISNVRLDIGDDTVLISKVIDEKFPPYESVIPDNNEFSVEVSSKELLSAIRRIALFSNYVSKQIKLNFNDQEISLKAADEETGSSGEEIVNCDFVGEDITIAFNYVYLEDALANIEPKETTDNLINMTFSEPNKPVLVIPKNENNNLLMLIMPVRIS